MGEPVFTAPITPPPDEDEELPHDTRGALQTLHRNLSRNCRLQYAMYRGLVGDPLDPTAPRGLIPRLRDLELKVEEHIVRIQTRKQMPSARKKLWTKVWIAGAIGAATVVGASFGAKLTAVMGWGQSASSPPSHTP